MTTNHTPYTSRDFDRDAMIEYACLNDPRVGVLCRNGRSVYYVIQDGQTIEGATARDVMRAIGEAE